MPTDTPVHRLLPQLRRVVLAHDRETGDAQLLGAFVASADEAAFSALVRRHGAMVLGVCRRVTCDLHLAEDAFQATFLVLARRAAAVRPRHLVGHWLYGVAYRTALKARGAAARRKAKEKQVDVLPHSPASPDEAWSDLQPVLDAELARLPEKYRVPIVLCDLNGRPQRDVARELKVPPATLANRLGAARRLLAKRLTARGVALSAGAVAAALGWHAATSAVPPALANVTVRAACAVAAGTPVPVSIPVAQLSEGVMRMFVVSKLRAVAAGAASCLLLLAGLAIVASPSRSAGPDDKPAPDKAKPSDPHRLADNDDLTFLRRQSLDLRGMLPTVLEAHYFVADKDAKKRAKVTEWMLAEHGGQKPTALCASCHKGTPLHPAIGRIPYLRGLFPNWDPHKGAGVAFVDLDSDGRLDVLLMDHWDDPLQPNPEVAAARAEAQLARASVAAAEAELKEVERVVQTESTAGKARLEQARARLEAAKVDSAAMEAQLSQTLARLRAARLVLLRSAASEDPATTEMDRAILRQWAQLKSPTTSDAEFLRRVSLDIRGVPPTMVEENYFVADKDPRKREKLLEVMAGKSNAAGAREKFVEELLADPEVQKRWAELWKQRMETERRKLATETWVTKPPADRLERLLAELLNGKRTEDQILDAVCLATMARFPTETEKKLILEGLKGQPDRRAAWGVVLKALAATPEAKQHAEGLAKRGGK